MVGVKLTREQADYLREEIDKLPITCPGGFADGFNDCEINVKKIINQCTEKEFPDFTMPTHNDFNNLTGPLSISLYEKNRIKIQEHSEGFFSLLHGEFKAFTDGCVKICDWLDEKNE